MKKSYAIILVCIVATISVVSTRWYKTHIWQHTIINELKRNLVDPDSLQVEFLCYSEGYTGSPTLYEKQHTACALVNAKNRMGGYTGQKLMAFSLSKDNTNASIAIQDVNIPAMCQKICDSKSWSKTNDEVELLKYIIR